MADYVTAVTSTSAMHPAIAQLLQPTPDLGGKTDIDLVSEYGGPLGQFWAALAELVPDRGAYTEPGKKGDGHVPSSPLDQPARKRNRITVEHADMVDSTQILVGSSSPAQESSQVSARDDAFVAENHEHDPMAREVNTERLLTCFVRYILYSIPYLDWALNNRLDCRTHLATKVTMTGGWVIQAEYDGGLRLRRGIASDGDDGLHVYYIRSRSADCYHVMFEAKKAFQINDGQPTISANWLGQMTAEALVGRLARSNFNSESHVLIIAAALHFVCFLDFDITDSYLEDIQQETPMLTLPVGYTSWLDLKDHKERRYAVENMARLIQLSE
ncbi:hypothetical protein EKO27_g11055 [Xylaria grammica]|uniref:Uncharacterized protein n=1 Tax=Xylaria grammica TaxID=363999 RepID=A0A439CPH5_9PEZI|nr:hypothetical protein EKO27_g11055 [Xylaria grammica]